MSHQAEETERPPLGIHIGTWTGNVHMTLPQPLEIPEAKARPCPQCELPAWANTRWCPHCGYDFNVKHYPHRVKIMAALLALAVAALLALTVKIYI